MEHLTILEEFWKYTTQEMDAWGLSLVFIKGYVVYVYGNVLVSEGKSLEETWSVDGIFWNFS